MPDSLEINRTLGRLESKVDTLLESMTSQNTRITSLERWRAALAGAWAVLAAGISAGFALLMGR